MEVLQCPPPDPAGDAAALVAATSPPVPTASTAATPARSAYQPGLCVKRIPMNHSLPLPGKDVRPPGMRNRIARGNPALYLAVTSSPRAQKTTNSNESCHMRPELRRQPETGCASENG